MRSKRPKYFDYAVKGNLVVLVPYMMNDDAWFSDFLAASDGFDFKQTGRRKGA